jgi:hypothetical protein
MAQVAIRQTSSLRNVFEGVVDGVSATGIRIGDRWYNYSKYVDADYSWPVIQRGDSVSMKLSGDNWIKDIQVIHEAPVVESDEPDPFESPAAAGRNGNGSSPKLPRPALVSPPTEPSQLPPKDLMIARMSNLKCASEIIAAGVLPVDALFDLAEQMVAWTLRK